MKSKKIKLLIIVDAWFPVFGGGQVHVWELSKELVKLGYEITIFTRNLGNWGERHPGIKVVRIGNFKKFENIFGRLEFLVSAFIYSLKFDYDILSLQAFSPGLLAPIIKIFKPKKPIVFTAHGTGFKVAGLGVGSSFLEKLVFYKIKYDLEVTVAKNTFIKKPDTKKVKVIPNGVSISRFYKAWRLRKKVIHLLYIGRLVEDKGVGLLVQAFRKLNDKNLDLTIVGEGIQRLELEKLSEGLNIKFTGKLLGQDLVWEMRKADLLVMPSLVEGQPIRLLEAWAAKLPVIATKVGDNELYIKDGVNGFLCEVEVSSLSQKIEKIIKMKNLSQVANQGFKDVQKYTWEKIAKLTNEAYMEVINEKA